MKNNLYPYPVETLKHWYIAPIGGQSPELKANQIGLNREALIENTDLVPYEDRVLISKLDGPEVRPLMIRDYFTVVPLDETSPDATSKSPCGEVVLPVQNKNDLLSGEFRIGEPVVLNSVLSQRYPGGLARVMENLLHRRSGLPVLEYREQ